MLVDLAGREQERLSMCRTERFKDHLVGVQFWGAGSKNRHWELLEVG